MRSEGNTTSGVVRIRPSKDGKQPDPSPELDELYRDFERNLMVPLWTEIGDLMPVTPSPRAVSHRWDWKELLDMAERAGDLVPVGRGGERRAIALANPGLGGAPYATPTLWAAIQYLREGESAPEHRHTQNAFRFVVEGEGVWTVVDGDPVAMRRGDLLLTPGWAFHGHHNAAIGPMAWLDGLDIPLVRTLDASFFEFGPEQPSSTETPYRSRAERLWAHPGLRPLSAQPEITGKCPLPAFRWENTDAALRAQLELESDGQPGVVEPGHAAVRYSNPMTGGDVMPSIRAEFHRIRDGVRTATVREVGSSVWQVFDGSGTLRVGSEQWALTRGDLVVIPSWEPYSIEADTELDLFSFSDAPVLEALGLHLRERLEP